MQKSHKISLSLGDTCIETSITISETKQFDPTSFFENYPHVFFRPKGENFDFFSSGAVLYDQKYPNIQAFDEIPFFTFGENRISQSKELGTCFGFIPKKWAITENGKTFIYELSMAPLGCDIENLPEKIFTTDQVKATRDISNIIDLIHKQKLQKCVYGHIQEVSCTNDNILKSVINHPFQGTKFFVKLKENVSFFGISPEWLYKRKDSKIFVDALAGTVTNHDASLISDHKITDEFSYVKKDILNSLRSLIDKGSFQDNDQIYEAFNLIHRYNRFEGILKDNISDQNLIQALHPTAAISGYPKSSAQVLSKELETSPRGFFASPIGFYTPKKAYIAVAIRSGLVIDKKAYVFSGAGIVKDSCPTQEWEELQNKLLLAKSLLSETN